MTDILERLLQSEEPSVRYRVMTGVLGKPSDSAEMSSLQEEVRNSARVKTMLAPMQGQSGFPWNVYQKWKGAFWTLLVLSDLVYPAGDKSLQPLVEQDYDWLLGEKHIKNIPLINGRWRRCVCQEGGALFSIIRLGLVDSRVERLAESILKWQWPDGGWNCDKHPSASHSSFHETFIPLRAVNAYWKMSGDPRAGAAVERACELFLSHSLYRRSSNKEIINPAFTQLAYPAFWHYDILCGLKALAEAGRLSDPRCQDALDLLESKRLPDGGFAADAKYYRVTQEIKTGTSFVDWGGTSSSRANPFVTAEVLCVLKQAGRI